MNPKQKRFCEHYAQTLNATKSAEFAGYAKNSARQQGARLLSDVNIKAEIAQMIGAATARAEISLDWVLAELKSIVAANFANYCKWSNKTVDVTPSASLSQELLAAVEYVSLSTDKSGMPIVRVKTHSKLQAAGLILKLYELSETEARLDQIEEKLRAIQAKNG